MITKDGWKMSVRVEWVPIEPDCKVGCHVCRGTGKDFFGEDDCDTCYGNGFKYTNNSRGPQPSNDPELVKRLRQVYIEWEETMEHL